MNTTVAKEIQSLSNMTMSQLHKKYFEVFGELTRSRNKTFLNRRIAWRIQANAFGDLSSPAKKRAEELANDADIRLRPPSQSQSLANQNSRPRIKQVKQRSNGSRDPRLPAPGTILTKTHKGQEIAVKVLEDSFEFEGMRYKTLSAIPKKVTGKQWNGYTFFGLNKKSE